jgi:Na+/H+ antiporter NhaD/arsenite permease-like protein
MSANIEQIIQSIDISSIMYLTGILLAVGALTSLGVLAYLSHVALGTDPSNTHIIALSSGLGLLSAAVDNSALVAIAMQVFPIHDSHIWALIGIITGTAGSLTIFGSAAGIVAMGSLKQLTFLTYFKTATLPVLIGMAAAFSVWLLQYHFIWHG